MKAFLFIRTVFLTGLAFLILCVLGGVSFVVAQPSASEVLVESLEQSGNYAHFQVNDDGTDIITHTYAIDQCCGTPGTQRSPQLDFRVALTTTSVLGMRYDVSSLHCSDIKLHLLVDNQEVYVTGFMGPLSGVMTTGFLDLGPVSSGNHSLTLSPEGRIGGCNTGTLHRWLGTLVVNVSVPVDCSVPFFSQRDDDWEDHPLRTDENSKHKCSPSCNTIGKCGCTLTSAAMVFNTYGANANPPQLSDCMDKLACPFDWKKGADCSNGKVGWKDQNRVSWNDANPAESWSHLEREINQNHRPGILGMCKKGTCGTKNEVTHWIVVHTGRGTDPEYYLIHDPWYKCGANIPLAVRSEDWNFVGMSVYTGTVQCSSLTGLTPPCMNRGANPQPVQFSPPLSTNANTRSLFVDSIALPGSNISGTVWIYTRTELTMTIEITAASSVGNITDMVIWSDTISNTHWQPFTPFVWLPAS